MILGGTDKCKKEFSMVFRILRFSGLLLTVVGPRDIGRLSGLLVDSILAPSSSSKICTWLGRTNTPNFGLHLKYGLPWTDPSFLPLGSNLSRRCDCISDRGHRQLIHTYSSIPTHFPVAKSGLVPIHRTIPSPAATLTLLRTVQSPAWDILVVRSCKAHQSGRRCLRVV